MVMYCLWCVDSFISVDGMGRWRERVGRNRGVRKKSEEEEWVE